MPGNVDSTLSVIAKDNQQRQVHRPGLFLVLEAARPTAGGARFLLDSVDVIEIGRGPARNAERSREGNDRVLRLSVPDRWMSSKHARLEHRFGRWLISDHKSKNGTAVNGSAIRSGVLGDGDVICVGHTLLAIRFQLHADKTEPEILDSEKAPSAERALATLRPELSREFKTAARLASSADISFLIRGESGTGKEVLAKAVHRLSGRSGSMIAVNCGAVAKNLIESELFGHVRGAFSGAEADKLGLIRSAEGGTLLLDEIGDLPLPSQAALLRVLQEREVVPVGAARPVPVDVRVLSATHRDLDAMVTRGEFRADLYARLAGYIVTLAPLRDRIDDLGVITKSLWEKLRGSEREHPGMTLECAQALFRHQWPLNIRELEAALRAGLALCQEQPLGVEHLPNSVLESKSMQPTAASAKDEALRETMEAQLREHRGNISAIARELGKDRKQIQRWLKRLKIDANDFR